LYLTGKLKSLPKDFASCQLYIADFFMIQLPKQLVEKILSLLRLLQKYMYDLSTVNKLDTIIKKIEKQM
jgi:hypothetical protein